MQIFATPGPASHRLDDELSPTAAPPTTAQNQEAFEHERARRALFRAVGEASPVIMVLLVLLVFSLIF